MMQTQHPFRQIHNAYRRRLGIILFTSTRNSSRHLAKDH